MWISLKIRFLIQKWPWEPQKLDNDGNFCKDDFSFPFHHSLPNLSHEYPLVLKLDCELCEYKIILNTTKEILQRFEMILIEFHDGNRNLIEKLTGIGFKVSILNSRFTFKRKYRGHLLAVNTNY